MRSHQRETNDGEPAEIPVKKAGGATQAQLKEVQEELAKHIRTVGQALQPLLLNLKLFKMTNPDARLRVPGTRLDFAVPNADTHFAYTLISRSELTARLLCDHAAKNETLLKWLIRFNGWFKGGETGSLVGAHVVAAVSSAGASGALISTVQGSLIPDVLAQVQEENYSLHRQLEELQRQMAAQGRMDERGAGN